MTSSTELPPESATCPNCGVALEGGEATLGWYPRCGARLLPPSVIESRWKMAVTAITSCATFLFGVYGPCALVIYGGFRLAKSGYGFIALGALLALFVIFHVSVVLKVWRRKL